MAKSKKKVKTKKLPKQLLSKKYAYVVANLLAHWEHLSFIMQIAIWGFMDDRSDRALCITSGLKTHQMADMIMSLSVLGFGEDAQTTKDFQAFINRMEELRPMRNDLAHLFFPKETKEKGLEFLKIKMRRKLHFGDSYYTLDEIDENIEAIRQWVMDFQNHLFETFPNYKFPFEEKSP